MAAALPLTGGYAVLLGDDQAAAADKLLGLVRLANADHLRWRLGLRAERRVERWVEREPWALVPFGVLGLAPQMYTYRNPPTGATVAGLCWSTFGPYRVAALAAYRRDTWVARANPFVAFQALPYLRGYFNQRPEHQAVVRTLAWLVERQLDPAEAMFAESKHGRREIDEGDLGPIADWLEEHDHPVDAVRVWMACRGHF